MMKLKRNTFNKIRLWGFVFLLISFFFGIFYIYFRTHAFTINSYELVGVPDMYKETIVSDLNTIASQTRYKIFPSNRIFNYRSMAIKSAVVNTLPNSKTVTLMPVGLHTLRVKVTSYEPLFKIDDIHGITKDGVMYTEFKDMSSLPKISFASSSRVEIVKDGITSTLIIGVDSVKLNNISTLINKINSVIFEVKRIDVDEYNDVYLYGDNATSRVVFPITGDINRIWSNLVSAIDTEPLKSKLSNEKDKLEYLDTRFGNKVFYMFTKGGKTDIIQSHATTTASTTIPQ